MTHHLDADDYFIQRVQWHCAAAGLNFFLIEPLWVREFQEALRANRVWARALINMHSEHHQPEDIYHQLILLAAERNILLVDPPAVALAAFDKARLHPQLEAAGIPVPPTVIVPAEAAAAFQLSAADRERLGSPFVIKPCRGYGRRGVLLKAESEADLAASMAQWPDSHYLLQKRIVPALVGEEPAYFRVFYVFGAVWSCWWNCHNDRYRLMSTADHGAWQLDRAEAKVRRIAALTGMNFFSTEFAFTEDRKFVAIDYVNDQCHLLSQSISPANGVPDSLVAAIAKQLVEGVRSRIQKS